MYRILHPHWLEFGCDDYHSNYGTSTYYRIAASHLRQDKPTSYHRTMSSISSSYSSPLVKFGWTKVDPRADPTHGAPCTRSSHGLSLFGKGRRLVLFGGEHIARTPLDNSQTTWFVDDLDGKEDDSKAAWRLLSVDASTTTTTTPAYPPLRVAHAQAVYNDSIVYIFGGRAGITMQEKAMNDLWKLDCSGPVGDESWSLVQPDLENGGPPPEERSFHKMLCVGDNLFVFGGCSANHGRLADIHRFHIPTSTWHDLGPSTILRGRGGANFMTFASETLLGVVAGFCGEESNDGHMFHVKTGQWSDEALTPKLEGLRPRSVCVASSFPSSGVSVIVGGEVDPSAKGHEGAGNFENDIVLLDEKTGSYLTTIQANHDDREMGEMKQEHGATWPKTRGWSDCSGYDIGNGNGYLYVFGGLTGDDANPIRLNDLWRLDIQKVE